MPGSIASDSCILVGKNFFPLPDFFGGGGEGLKRRDWDWLRELMMVSQITAWDGGEGEDVLEEGYVAVIHTKSCFVFQLKSEVKSRKDQSRSCIFFPSVGRDLPASRSNFMWAYSSFLGE